MFFSIIIPVYNVEQYLAECVDSILSQTFEDYEVILIDDGSPDRSGAICDEYALRDDRIKVIHKENSGVSDTRNTGMKVAKGEYILFLDSDDGLFDETVLMRLYKRVEEKQFPDVLIQDLNYGLKEVCDGQTLLLKVLQTWDKNKELDTVVWNKLFKRQYLIENSIYFLKGYVHEDDYWVPIAIVNAKKCALMNENICNHRTNEYSITQNPSEQAIMRRVRSKLHVGFQVVDYFKNYDCSEEVRQEAYKIYISLFLTGLTGSFLIKSRDFKKELKKKRKETAPILLFAQKSNKKSHRTLAKIYKFFGIGAVMAVLKLKTMLKK